MKKIILSLSTVIIIIAAFIALSVNSKIFTSEKWSKSITSNDRYKMLDDLKEKYNFYNMTYEEIVNLLGESETPYAYVPPAHEEYLEYRVGSYTIDPTMLTIEFENGKVVDVYLYTEFRSSKKPLY